MGKIKGQKHSALRLTALQVQALVGGKERKPGKFADGKGLYLVIAKTGSASWIFRYTYGGHQKELSFGPVSELTLKEARENLELATRHLAANRDPWSFMNAAARRQQEQVKAGVPTFLEAAKRYIADASPSFKSKKTLQAWDRAMLHYAKPLHGKPMNAITPDDIADVLKPIWRAKLETARKLRWRLEAVFAEAIPKGFRNTTPSGEIIQTRNPAEWDNNLAAMAAFKKSATKRLSKVRHHPSLPYQELPAFYSELHERPSDAAWGARKLHRTDFEVLSELGPKNARASHVKLQKWRWLTLSAMRWSVAMPAPICLRSESNLWRNGLSFARNGTEAMSWR